MVVPLIVTFAAAGGTVAGIAALATSGIAGFLTVAGGVLSAVGGLTGNKKLTKIGGIMGLAGGLASGFNAMSAANAAEGAGGVAGELVGPPEASGVFDGSSAAAESARLGNYAPVGEGLGEAAADTALGGDFATISDPGAAAYSGPGSSAGMIDNTSMLNSNTIDSMLKESRTAQAARPGVNQPTNNLGDATNKVGEGVNKIGSHVKANKELYHLAGGMLQGMFGPQAEALDLEKSQLERRRRNLNNIVRVG